LEKKLCSRAKRIQHQHPLAAVEVWGMDEHRLRLKPIIRRVWVGYGEQPIAKVNWRYQWLWLYGFVHPSTGETYFWILPKVNIELFNLYQFRLRRNDILKEHQECNEDNLCLNA
jgi:hypothetical protein